MDKMVYKDTCCFCGVEDVLCNHFLDDNGSTLEAVCKSCLEKQIEEIEKEENQGN